MKTTKTQRAEAEVARRTIVKRAIRSPDLHSILGKAFSKLTH